MKKQLLTKALLLATGLLVGASAWGSKTHTYDFNAAITAGDKFSYEETKVTLYANTSKYDFGVVQNTTTLQLDGRLASYTNDLLLHTKEGNGFYSSNGRYMAIRNLNAGDQVIFTYHSGDASTANIAYQTRVGYGSASIGGDELSLGNSIGSGDVVTILSGSYLVVQPSKSARITKIEVVSLDEEESELFIANETGNDTYSVGSSSNLSDGKNVKSVYGITMTYRGAWTYANTSNRGGNMASGTYPQSVTVDEETTPATTNNLPNNGGYLEFTPSVTGNLQINVNEFKGVETWFFVDKANGHIFKSFKPGANNYTEYRDFGTIVAGRTYILYALNASYGYALHGFKFTPGENDITSYTISSDEIIKGGSTIDYVTGVNMTFGGTAEEQWVYGRGWNNGRPTYSDNLPTTGTYLIFNPTVDGRLTVNTYIYAGNDAASVCLTDGTNELDTYSKNKGDGNAAYTAEFSTILRAGTTYYCYITNVRSFTNGFYGFSYEQVPPVAVSVTSVGYATYCPTVDLDFSKAENIEACIAAVDDNGKIAYTVVETVAAGEGVLLRSKSGGAASEKVPVLASATKNAGNAFVGITEKQKLAQTDEDGNVRYILSKVGDVVGFYKVNENGSWVNASTAYLSVESAKAKARSFFALDGSNETTGINAVEAVSANAAVYNLNGQSIGQPTKGLYIVNGKKVIIK